MALRYLPMISGQQHHHHGNEKQQPVHLPVAVYSGQEQPQGPECKQTVTTHRYPNRYFPRDDLGNKQLDSDHNRQSPQQPLGSEYPPGNRIASHDPTAVSQKMSPIRISILHTSHKYQKFGQHHPCNSSKQRYFQRGIPQQPVQRFLRIRPKRQSPPIVS